MSDRSSLFIRESPNRLPHFQTNRFSSTCTEDFIQQCVYNALSGERSINEDRFDFLFCIETWVSWSLLSLQIGNFQSHFPKTKGDVHRAGLLYMILSLKWHKITGALKLITVKVTNLIKHTRKTVIQNQSPVSSSSDYVVVNCNVY